MRTLMAATVATVLLSVSPALGSFSSFATATGQVNATATLAAPTGVGASVISCFPTLGPVTVRVSWQQVSLATSYRVERRTTGSFTTVATVTALQHTENVSFSTTYRYRITALRGNWSSPVSSEALVTTPSLLCL